MRIPVLLIHFCLLWHSLYAQYQYAEINPGNKKLAKTSFESGNLKKALEEYKKLWLKDSTNTFYNQRMGLCLINLPGDKALAVKYLREAVQKKKSDPYLLYALGQSYLLNYQFDDAIDAFTWAGEAFENSKKNKPPLTPVEKQIQYCLNAKVLVTDTVPVTFENLGKRINTKFAEYNPFVSDDEQTLIFTSRQDKNTGRTLDDDGNYFPDIYSSALKNHNWYRSRNLGRYINTEMVEECVGMSNDGNDFFIFADNIAFFREVVLSSKSPSDKNFQDVYVLFPDVNTSDLLTSATLRPNKNTMYYCAKKPEGPGGLDIYSCQRKDDGTWTSSLLVQGGVNSWGDENFPSFSADGQTMYFSSTGHNSMGGYDLFKSVWVDTSDTWSEPINLGYPVNTPDDNKTISFTKSGRHAYLSAVRPGGVGDEDIWRVTFHDIPPDTVLLKGYVTNSDSGNVFSTVVHNPDLLAPVDNTTAISVRVDVLNKPALDTLLTVVPERATGRFMVKLAPGNYSVCVSATGFNTTAFDFSVFDIGIQELIQTRHILLDPNNKK